MAIHVQVAGTMRLSWCFVTAWLSLATTQAATVIDGNSASSSSGSVNRTVLRNAIGEVVLHSVPDQCGTAEPGRNIGEGSIWEGMVKDAAACCAKCTALANCCVWEFEPKAGGRLAAQATANTSAKKRNCWVKDNVNKNETGHRISGVIPGRHPHPPIPPSPSPATRITVDVNGSVRTLDPMFLSFNIDANIFPALNFSRPQLIALASELQPAMMRLGGGAADLQAYN